MVVKPCEICGDASVPEAIITCSRCKSTREHLYCMRVIRTDVPQFWDCEECLEKKLVSPKSTATKQTHEASKRTVPTSMKKSPSVNEGPNKMVLPNRFNIKEKSVDTGKTRFLSCDEVTKLSSGANKLKCSPSKSRVIQKSMPPPRERTPVKSPQFESSSKSESVGKPSTGPKVTFCESPKISKRIETRSPVKSQQIERGSKSESDLQKLAGKQSTGPKVTFCESPAISKRIETTSTEREPKEVAFEVPCPVTVETDVDMDVDMDIDMDVDMDVEVDKSSEILAKTGIESGTAMGSKIDADLGAGSSDDGKHMLPSALSVCETFGPYIPALNSYWKGSFTLPHGHGNFDNIFLAHPPSRVHNKVYETIVKMPEQICFELVPNDDIYMGLFSGSLPDKDDIGLYFFPSFSHRSEETMTITDFLWSKNLLMHSLVNGVELLVFSSKLLKPSLQEFQGKCFLWGVFRRRKNSKPVTEAPLLLEDKSERRDDAPPGFESETAAPLSLEVKSGHCVDVPPGFEPVAAAPLLLKAKEEVCGDAPPGFEPVTAAPLLLKVKEEVCGDAPPGFEPIWKPKR